MSSTLAIAASGLATASVRLDVSASNVANLLTAGPLPVPDANPLIGASIEAQFPAAYAPLRVDQVDISGGTAETVIAATPSYVPSYEPGAAYADKNGLVVAPNVDLANEAVQQITARYNFAANAKVIRAASDAMSTLLDINA